MVVFPTAVTTLDSKETYESLLERGFTPRQADLMNLVFRMEPDRRVELVHIMYAPRPSTNGSPLLQIETEVLLREPFPGDFAHRLLACREFLDTYNLNKGFLEPHANSSYKIQDGFEEQKFSLRISARFSADFGGDP